MTIEVSVRNNNVDKAMRVLKKKLQKDGLMKELRQRQHFEKPSLKTAPSNYAIIGRYILPKIIISKLKKLKPGKGGEIHITDAIKKLIEEGEKFYGNIFKGKYLDCGTINGYISSGIQISKEKL